MSVGALGVQEGGVVCESLYLSIWDQNVLGIRGVYVRMCVCMCVVYKHAQSQCMVREGCVPRCLIKIQ